MKRYIVLIVGIIIVIAIIVLVIIALTHKDKIQDFIHKEKNPSSYEEQDFNLKLIKTVNSTQMGNYLVSPYSIEVALNMLKEGSSGDTLEEFNKVLPTRKMQIGTAKDRIGIANAIFLKDTYSKYIEAKFTKSLKNN